MNSQNIQLLNTQEDSTQKSVEMLLQSLKQKIDPLDNKQIHFVRTNSLQNSQLGMDLPKLISPKPQRPLANNNAYNQTLQHSQSVIFQRNQNLDKYQEFSTLLQPKYQQQAGALDSRREPFTQIQQNSVQNQSNKIKINLSSEKCLIQNEQLQKSKNVKISEFQIQKNKSLLIAQGNHTRENKIESKMHQKHLRQVNNENTKIRINLKTPLIQTKQSPLLKPQNNFTSTLINHNQNQPTESHIDENTDDTHHSSNTTTTQNNQRSIQVGERTLINKIDGVPNLTAQKSHGPTLNSSQKSIFTPFNKFQSENKPGLQQKLNLSDIQQKIATSLLLGNALSSINNIDFIENKINIIQQLTLPDSLSMLIKQASENYQQIIEKTVMKKILGKRKRNGNKQQQRQNRSGQMQLSSSVSQHSALLEDNQSNEDYDSYQERDDSSNQNTQTQFEDDLNFITSNQIPNKRRHISSMTKAMLAKKILNKIETENDPNSHVIPKFKQSESIKNEQQFDLINEVSVDQKEQLSIPTQINEEKINKLDDTKIAPTSDPNVKSCNCKRSKCLKLYCECFANNKFCGALCACNGCSNVSEHDEERLLAKEQILMRNPLAFRPKIETSLDENSLFKKDIKIDQINIQQQSEVLLQTSTKPSNFGLLAVGDKEKRHFKGCNCRKSFCQKKYCECYQQGVDCTELCKCEECKNVEGHKPNTFEQMFKVSKVAKSQSQVDSQLGKENYIMDQNMEANHHSCCSQKKTASLNKNQEIDDNIHSLLSLNGSKENMKPARF